MESIKQLELSLKGFHKIVKRLSKHPCLDTALDVNLASLRLEELFYKIESDGGNIPEKDVSDYVHMVDRCIFKINKMIPGSNGESWHLDLYREQMDGRKDLIRRMMEEKSYN